MYELPTLADLLSVANLAEVARRIGRPRGFAWRLAHGGRLADASVIPALAAALHQPVDRLTRIIEHDDMQRSERSA